MPNTLYLPELREMLAEENTAELREFCEALHPARTAEFMEGLTADEAWKVLRHADETTRREIFSFFEREKQVEIVEKSDRTEIAGLVASLPADDRVDLLNAVDPEVKAELMPLLPVEDRREVQRLSAFPENTAGAVMTTEFARLSEDLTAAQALQEIGRQAEHLETVSYLYVLDREAHLRGLLSARALISSIGKPNQTVAELMDRDLVTVHVMDDREEVARKVARYDLLAIPVVDDEYRMLGIITHDDVIDVMVEEAAEDAYHSAAVYPLQRSYLQTKILTLTWKRGLWLTILFFGALLTILTLHRHEEVLNSIPWLVFFIQLIVSTGGNSGNQSATLVITAMSTGDVQLTDWWRIVWRELAMGLLLGGLVATIGYFVTLPFAPSAAAAVVIPITLLLIVICGTMTGSMLPLLFRRLGLDPALMSNPFVAGIMDVVGILIYMNVAMLVLGGTR